MTDKQWEKLIIKANNIAIKHRNAIKTAEEEYVKRYGHNPSEVDDDWWIDTVHCGNGNPSIKGILSSARQHLD